jgi:hypothetical protein
VSTTAPPPRPPAGSSEVDELFGEGGGAPKPRHALAVVLLAAGLLLAVVGLPCSTAPGGALVLLAWLVVEKDIDRLESGYLPADTGRGLSVLRAIVRLGVVAVIVLTAIQGVLVCGLFYPEGWGELLFWLMGIEVAPTAPPI